MAKDLRNKADVDKSMEAQEGGGGLTLKIPEGKTPIYILSSGYEDGYVHWVDVPGTGRIRVVCGGGLEGKGYAPDKCPLCAYSAAMYKKAKELVERGDASNADKLKKRGNDVHAKYEAYFVAAKGEMVKVKDESGKHLSADYDECEVGILSMTTRQYQDFMALVGSEKFPHIKTNDDLLNRSIMLDKAKRESGGKPARYATIEFVPARTQSDAPATYKPEDYPLADYFVIDAEQIDKAAAALSSKGGHSQKRSADEFSDDAYEADTSVDDFVSDDADSDLDDSDLAADDVSDDGFLDDVDGDEPEEKQPAKKQSAKPGAKPAAKTGPVKAAKKPDKYAGVTGDF